MIEEEKAVQEDIPMGEIPLAAPEQSHAAHGEKSASSANGPCSWAALSKTRTTEASRTATLRDFVEGLKSRSPSESVVHADTLGCGNVWFRKSLGSIEQSSTIRTQVRIRDITPDHLVSCNMVSLRGEAPCDVATLIAKLEPLVTLYGAVTFVHRTRRVVLASPRTGADSAEVEFMLVPSFDKKLFKDTDEIVANSKRYTAHVRSVCSAVMAEFGQGPISIDNVYRVLQQKAPKDWVTEAVFIDRMLIPMEDFMSRFDQSIDPRACNILFGTHSPTGLCSFIDVDDDETVLTIYGPGKLVFMHVPRNERMTMQLLEANYGDPIARARHMMAALESQ